jgi:hypothetical protein
MGVRGRFVWYEALTKDPVGAIAFYPKVLGWGTSTMEVTGQSYTMWTVADAPIGGVMQLPPDAVSAGAPSHWLMYVGSDDVDATAKQAVDLGGKVCVAPQDIPSIGRFAVLTDPQGAMFAIYKSMNPAVSPIATPGLGHVSWHELATTDHAAAFRFYHTLFGWDETGTHDMGPLGVYRMIGHGTLSLGAIFNKPPEMPWPPNWLLYVRVADINATVSLVKQHGGQILNGPMEVPGGDWIAQCLDPQGAAFAVHQVKS